MTINEATGGPVIRNLYTAYSTSLQVDSSEVTQLVVVTGHEQQAGGFAGMHDVEVLVHWCGPMKFERGGIDATDECVRRVLISAIAFFVGSDEGVEG